MSPRAANGGITDMMTYARPLMAPLLALVLLLGTAPRARAATSPSEGEAQAIGRTPPRLSYINGEVSFLPPGAPGWSPPPTKTPPAPRPRDDTSPAPERTTLNSHHSRLS